MGTPSFQDPELARALTATTVPEGPARARVVPEPASPVERISGLMSPRGPGDVVPGSAAARDSVA